MPGGQEEAYNKVADILDAIAAKAKTVLHVLLILDLMVLDTM